MHSVIVAAKTVAGANVGVDRAHHRSIDGSEIVMLTDRGDGLRSPSQAKCICYVHRGKRSAADRTGQYVSQRTRTLK